MLSSHNKSFEAVAAILGWFSLLLQLYLIIIHRHTGIAETITRFFSFFTILSNILVAICFTRLATRASGTTFFTRGTTLTATCVYIIIVGLVYNLVLRFLWQPSGLQRIADELLHVVMPVLFTGYWIIKVRLNNVRWLAALYWLIFPGVYILYTIARGAITGYYPYPFINVNKIGYPEALRNTFFLLVAFFSISLLMIAIGNRKFNNSTGNVA